MNGRTIARVLLALVIIGGVALLGVGAYNAGVTQGLLSSGQVVGTPGAYPGGPYVGGWGYGWGPGPGFGFFGFLGTLFFIFLIFALLRAAFGRGRGWGGGGWGGPGSGRYGRGPWEDRAREIHDEWHRSHPDAATRDDSGQPKA
jgi:hypothetical protein